MRGKEYVVISEVDIQARNRKKRKTAALIGISSLILVAMVVAVGAEINHKYSNKEIHQIPSISITTKTVQDMCQTTNYQETCINTLSSSGDTNMSSTDSKQLILKAFHAAVDAVSSALANSSTIKAAKDDPRTSQALESCKEVMNYAISDLQRSIDSLQIEGTGITGFVDLITSNKFDEFVEDIRIWLSGAATYEETCIDAFENTTGDAGERMKQLLNSSQTLTSNGLAMATQISSVFKSFDGLKLGSRRLLSEEEENSWVGDLGRKLLQANNGGVQADVVVAQDGSGKYNNINQALGDVPKNSNKTFVIHIKTGVYKERVEVGQDMQNVMFVGDGPTQTKITGDLNFVDGTPTYKTATVTVVGDGFIAKDIGIENTAGPEKHQAVALLVQADRSIFYNCQIDGYQDTLYAHSHRQFYRDCTISGTIDFIFGDAAVVLQNCKLIIRKPLDNQQCIVTAQGRTDKNEATGIVLQNCTILGDPTTYIPFKNTMKSYLGRPWKQYSRTIVMESEIDDVIAPEGWLPWMGNFGLDTCFYSEYKNRGPGSVMNMRVKWPGIKTLSPDEADGFTPAKFVFGDTWIQSAGVPYVPGMLPAA